MSILLRQFLQRLIAGVIHQIPRAAGPVVERGTVDVDPQVVIELGEDFLEVDGTLAGVFPEPVGRTDDLAGANAAIHVVERMSETYRGRREGQLFAALREQFRDDRDARLRAALLANDRRPGAREVSHQVER